MRLGDERYFFKTDDEIEQAFRQGLTTKCEDLRIEQIAAHYGFTSQADMLCEEAAEFMVALSKLRRGQADAYENIKEEVADVLIMARQLRYLIGYEKIDQIVNEKLNRQMKRIQAEDHSFAPNISKAEKLKIFEERLRRQRNG